MDEGTQQHLESTALHQMFEDQVETIMASRRSGLDHMKSGVMELLTALQERVSDTETLVATVENGAKEAMEKIAQSSDWSDRTLVEDGDF